MMVVDQDIKVGYKQTVIGVIPVDWRVKEVVDLASIKTGNKDTQDKLEDGEYPFFVRSQSIERINSYSFDGEAVLTSGDGVGVGKIYHYINGKFDYHQRVYNIHSFKKEILGQFFYFFFSQHFRKRVYRLSAKNSVDSVRYEMIAKMKIPLPPLTEQRKIAEILSTWDEAIAQTKALIEQLKLRNKGLAQQLLTGKKRLKGFTGEWKEVKAEYIFKNHTDKSHNGDLEVLSATQENGVIPRSQNNIDIKFDPTTLHTYKKVEKGDFVISLRSFQGGIEFSEYEGLVSPAYTVLKEVEPISKTFYRIYLKTETFINRLNTIIYGIRDGKQIGYKDFSTLKIPHPSIQEQEGIAEILEVGIQELNGYESHLEFLYEQKKGLMQKLLTGEVRTT